MGKRLMRTDKARAIMIQGTSSHVGKSVLTTALCRIFREDGYKVAPFKSQNMALNARVTHEGGEMGWAQWSQALAAGVEPSVLMNPILLKPKGDNLSQVIVKGKPVGDMSAVDYRQLFLPKAWEVVKECYHELACRYEIVVIEGAGSPAEINLMETDIANMKVARMAKAPVILVTDIDRGGAFASLVGTLELLPPEDKKLIAGFVINKFRGDFNLLKPGIEWLERRTNKPVLGVIPFTEIDIGEEDSVALQELKRKAYEAENDGKLEIGIIVLPRISNFTDFDPLKREDGVRIRWVNHPGQLGNPDAVIIPGSKNSMQDLLYLKKSGLAERIRELAKTGTVVMGICGGYQMLGNWLYDPDEKESTYKLLPGLGLLDVETTFGADKVTVQTEGKIMDYIPLLGGEKVKGYEIHMGMTTLGQDGMPLMRVERRMGKEVQDVEGAINEQGNVMGTYMHGFFDEAGIRKKWLAYVRKRGKADIYSGIEEEKESFCLDLDRYGKLAAFFRQHLNVELIYKILFS